MAILATFEEVELSRDYTGFATGGPGFQTGIVGNSQAVQQRTVNQYDAIRSYEIQFAGMQARDGRDPRQELEEFFITKFGRAVGFRFFPPSDREFQNDLIGIGDGVTTRFYMQRNYASRSRFIQRRIVKPVKYTVVVALDDMTLWYSDGVAPPTGAPDIDFADNNVDIDWDQGIIDFAVAPTVGAFVQLASGEYDIPVYFEADLFSVTDYNIFASLDSVKVVEIPPSQITSEGLDLTPLSLAFTSPHSEEVKLDVFDVMLSHTGVTKVYLYRDGTLVGTDTSSPFSFISIAPGTDRFTLKAVGFDASGHYVEASIDLSASGSLIGPVPCPVTGLALEVLGDSSIRATWDAGDDDCSSEGDGSELIEDGGLIT